MDFLAALQSFDMARYITFAQGIFLIGLIVMRLMQQWNIKDRWYNLAAMFSWLILVSVGTVDTWMKIGQEHVEWWRTPSRCIAYAIGIAGLLYQIQRDKNKLPGRDSNSQPSG